MKIKLSEAIKAIEKKMGKKLILKEAADWGKEGVNSRHKFTSSEIAQLNKGLSILKIKSGYVQSEDSINLIRQSEDLWVLSNGDSSDLDKDAKKLVENCTKLVPEEWGYIMEDYFVFDSFTEIRIGMA